MRLGSEVFRKLLLSGNVLARLALLGFVALFLSQLVVAAVRAQERVRDPGAQERVRDPGAPAESRGQEVSAVRIWPARDYTRVTIETRRPLAHSVATVKNPDRLVLDLEDAEFNAIAREIAGKPGADDPYVAAIRAGRFKPGVVRVVFDLKTEVKPQVFVLKPIGEYGHRLVLDLYPVVPVDPLMALLEQNERRTATEPAPAEARPSGEPATATAPPSPTAAGSQPATSPPAARPGSVIRLFTVALDAGHGGEDPGAKGRRGSYEKHITLAIARRLKALIDAEPNMRAVLTRDGDYFVPLQTRVEKARRVKADLFVSIHADAFIKPHARGSSVFALSERGATSTAARWLAKRENDADLVGGVNLDVKDRHLAQTLLDLSQTATIQDSLKLGRAVLSELGGINTLHKDAVEQAGFAVLKAPDIPSILVETAFISNPEEEAKLNDEDYQQKMAQAILRGIKRYAAKTPSLQRPVVASTPSPATP